jgi:hypothetical protein
MESAWYRRVSFIVLEEMDSFVRLDIQIDNTHEII